MSLVLVSAGLLIHHQKALLTCRPEGKSYAGYWELPGGKLEKGESPEQALCRELHEEIGITIKPEDCNPWTFVSHTYPDFNLLMPIFVCEQWEGDITPQENQDVAWVGADRVEDYPLLPADQPLVPLILGLLGS